MVLLPPKYANLVVGISLALFALTMTFLAFTTEGTGDWGDAIYHYLFSRFAFTHPENFLNHWAKPVFVFFTAPVAQGGFIAMKLFNIAMLVASAWLAWRVGQLLEIPNAWLAIFPMMTAPMNISHTLSGLTEPMFACWMMLGIYWLLKERWVWAILWMSFLPFVRSEGLIIFCVLVLYLAIKKRWYLIPLLAIGHIFYSLVGYIYYKDFLWVFNKMPYATTKGAYGSGEFWHYAIEMQQVMCDFLPILLLVGLLVGAVRLVLFWFKGQPFSKEELWLVYGISVAFFLAHSIFWRFGIFNSFGLLRVFMGVLPLFALIIVQGLNGVFQVVRFPKLQWAVAIVAVGTMFWYLKKHINIDYHLAPTSSQKGQNILLQKYAAQYKDYTYYFDAIHPALALDLDWFDPKVHRFTPQLFTGEPIPSKSIILWDDWFSKDESNMPLENLLNDARFQLIECLETGYDWEQPKKKNCLFVFDSTFANTSILLKNDFEKEDIKRDTTRSKTGKASLKLDRSYAFSPSFNGSLTSFQTTKQPMIRLSCWVYIPAAANSTHHTSKAVISFESSGKSFGYHAQPIVQKGDAKDQWKHLVLEQPIPTPKLMTDAVKVYLWNPDRVPIWVDDLVVEWVTNH